MQIETIPNIAILFTKASLYLTTINYEIFFSITELASGHLILVLKVRKTATYPNV